MASECPRCGKEFNNEMSTLAHLNQPISKCRRDFEAYLQENSHKRHERQKRRKNQSTHNNVPETFADIDMDSESEPSIVKPFDSGPSEPHEFFTEEFPEAAKTYGNGPTYMDKFDADDYAHLRRDCPYYPFSSRDEWELASFLLRSDLSMSAIDQFLKLLLVRITSIISVIDCSQEFYRSRVLNSRSKHRKLYAAVPKYFLWGPNGNASPGKPSIRRRSHSNSFLKTQSSVYRRLWKVPW